MALVTLRNGKTVDIDLWYYLNMSDDELQDLVAMNVGFEAENPFHSSSLTGGGNSKTPEVEDNDEDPPPVDEIKKFDDPELLERDDI